MRYLRGLGVAAVGKMRVEHGNGAERAGVVWPDLALMPSISVSVVSARVSRNPSPTRALSP